MVQESADAGMLEGRGAGGCAGEKEKGHSLEASKREIVKPGRS